METGLQGSRAAEGRGAPYGSLQTEADSGGRSPMGEAAAVWG